jgi:RNA polymerase sigma factor (sigma-70 family)
LTQRMDKEVKLIEGCLAGKRKAQSELYSRFAPLLYGICLRYASNRFEAQDMLQEGFIKVFSSLSSYESKGSFEGWVKRVVINNTLNHIRSNSKQKLFSDLAEVENVPDPVPEVDESPTAPDKEIMLRLIQELPEGYRMVFNLYVFEDYTHKEIAEVAGISENTSKTQLMRARNLLQKKISELHR